MKKFLWNFHYVFQSDIKVSSDCFIIVGKSFETSLLVISEILGLFVDTLTADDKYSPHKGENFLQIIQT